MFDEFLKSFADPTRFRILHLLANRGPEICVCDIVTILGLPQANVSRHLTRLRHLGLVIDRRQGTWMRYSLAKAENRFHAGLTTWLRENCQDEQILQVDLGHFDRLSETGKLAQCDSGRKSQNTENNNKMESPE